MNYHPKMHGHATDAVKSFMYAVYAWMSAALAVTAFISYSIAQSPELIAMIYKTPMVVMILFIVQIGVAIYLSASLQKIQPSTATILFFVYAALVGVTLSSVFLIYTQASIITTFITASGMFAGMALYGYFTNADLTVIGNIAIMVLWGLIVSMLINMFLQSSQFDLIISAVGVVVFALLTAYDTQKIKSIGEQSHTMDQATLNKLAVFGAFILYLDFINLFLYLLRFMGQQKRND
jgi:hypothetical protein